MSKPLSLSAAFCAFAMALFVLTADVSMPMQTNGATAEAAAPFAFVGVDR